MSKKKKIGTVLTVICVIFLAFFIGHLISNARNEKAVNKQLDSLSAYADKYLGENYLVDNSKRAITCWTAEQGPFGGGNQWCGGELTFISPITDSNSKQLKEGYQSIFSELVATGWTPFEQFPESRHPNNDPGLFDVDLDYRKGVVCYSSISNSSLYNSRIRHKQFIMKMSCSWRAGRP